MIPNNPHPVPMPDIDSISKERIMELLVDNYLKRLAIRMAIRTKIPSNPHPVPMPQLDCYESKESKNSLRRIKK